MRLPRLTTRLGFSLVERLQPPRGELPDVPEGEQYGILTVRGEALEIPQAGALVPVVARRGTGPVSRRNLLFVAAGGRNGLALRRQRREPGGEDGPVRAEVAVDEEAEVVRVRFVVPLVPGVSLRRHSSVPVPAQGGLGDRILSYPLSIKTIPTPRYPPAPSGCKPRPAVVEAGCSDLVVNFFEGATAAQVDWGWRDISLTRATVP